MWKAILNQYVYSYALQMLPEYFHLISYSKMPLSISGKFVLFWKSALGVVTLCTDILSSTTVM